MKNSEPLRCLKNILLKKLLYANYLGNNARKSLPALLRSDQVNVLILWMKAEKEGLFSALKGHFQC
jgi:hypothetical protein